MTRLFLCICACLSLSLVEGVSDRIRHDISTQPKCTEVVKPRTSKCEWHIGLYSNMDYVMLNGKIAAYQIQWFNKKWSEWFVPGVNDLDGKFNINPVTCGEFPQKGNTMRRMWSYFYDHTHKYILCSP